MMPSWDAIRETWPLIVVIVGLIWRVESAMSRQRAQSEENAREIKKLETKVDTQGSSQAGHAVQLGRIEEAIKGLGKTLDRLAGQIDGRR